MGAAIFGASGGAEWGRVRWLAWCDQVDQAQDRKPESFLGLDAHAAHAALASLRMFANQRAPYEMALRAFAEPEIEPEVIEQAGEEMDARRAFLEGWALVGGEAFYALPPKRPAPRGGVQRDDGARDEGRPAASFGRQQGFDRRRPLRPAQSEPGQRDRA